LAPAVCAPELAQAEVLAALMARSQEAVLLARPRLGAIAIVFANAAAGRLLDGDPAQLVGANLLTCGTVGADPATRTALRLALDSGYPYRGSAHLCRLDGSPFAASLDLTPVTTADGTLWLALIRAEVRAEPRPAIRAAPEPAATETLDLVRDGTPDLALLWDADDRLTDVGGNPAALLPGQAQAFKPGTSFTDLMRALVERRVFDLPLAASQRFLSERASQHREGGRAVEQLLKGNRWLRITEQRLAGGGAASLWSDVSKYRWLEQALSESEDRIRAVAASAPIVLFATDRAGNLTLCEGKGLAVLGVKADRLVGQSIRHRMRRYPGLIAALDQALAGETCTVSLRVGQRSYDAWLAPSRGPGGRIAGVIGVATDVTLQRQAENALRASEQRFQDVVRAADEVIWELTPDSRFSFVSDNCVGVLGAPAAVFVAADPMDLIAVDGRMRAVRRFALLRRRPRAFKDVELELALPDGRRVWASVSGGPTFHANGRLMSFRGVARDVTARRHAAAERLKAAIAAAEGANRAKSEFLANVSHELRTPLNAVIGFSEIMVSALLGPLPDAYRDYASDINSSGKHLLDLINDVLDLSKAEAGRLDLAEEMIEVEDVVEASLRFVRERAERLGVHLDTRLPPNLPRLLADERKVKQILLNLLSNAVKFTEAGGRVGVEAALAIDGGLDLTVADTGIGIRAEDIPVAMATFGQVDSSLSRRYEGTGLGLPLVKALIERHGGQLSLQSEPGVGTRVTVSFPPARVVAR
jgi:PAS domain S-box-containing protein